MENLFNNSKKYLNEIKHIKVQKNKRKEINGKSMITVWLTKICPANCEHCFSKSSMHKNHLKEKYQFSNDGVKKLIKFVNDSNNSYIMMSGGGEPMIYSEAVNKILQNVISDRIVVVTNGIWAYSYGAAENKVKELYNSFKSRKKQTTFILRLSVDKYHSKALKNDIIINIINVFKNNYSKEENFKLMLHTIKGDYTINEIIKDIPNAQIIINNKECISDNDKIVKIMPKKAILKIEDYEIEIGYAKLFYPNFKPDLNIYNEETKKVIDVFDEDMLNSEFGNPSVVKNLDNTFGLDFWIEYNGNVTTWGNQDNDSLYNIYTDDYKSIYDGTFNNIITYSFIDKGYYYREKIVNEVNPKAVLHSKVINLRNYTSALLLEEDKTKLYYAIRVVKDYINEGIIEKEQLSVISSELSNLILKDIEEIICIYRDSKSDIIMQSIERNLSKEGWDVLLLLLKLGHYEVSVDSIDKAIKEYNSKFSCKLTSLDMIQDTEDLKMYDIIKERISFMKEDAEKFCLLKN